MKRKLTTVLFLIFALVMSAAALTACGEKEEPPRQSGDEVGVYYCEVDGAEWTITLSEECKFTYSVAGETKSGTYMLEGTDLALLFENTLMPEQATLENGVLTYHRGGNYYRFLIKRNYTVTFMANGSVFKTVEGVLNGKPVARPADDPAGENGTVFVGWCDDSSAKNFYNFSRPVSGDLTLYARFVEAVAGETEYTVNFNLGYSGGEQIPDRRTVGGKIYDAPVPEREGDVFVGWWVSHYNDANKLTYRYEENELKADTTFFAVWQSDAPYVSMTDSGLVWSAEGAVNSYSVLFTAPDGTALYNAETGLTAYAFDFANATEGEYKASVTVGDKTTTAYFLNKALKKADIANFRVEGNTFLFNPVENATSYTLELVCATEGHDHSAVPLGSETHYDFSACELPADGFRFTVTASADGWLSSVSETFRFTRTLDPVANLTYDADTDVVSWEEVRNATSYFVTVTSGGSTVFSQNVRDARTFALSGYDPATYTVAVYPVARGWASPAALSKDFTKVRLSTPENVHLEGRYVTWNRVDNASGYEVKVGDHTYQNTSNRFEFTEDLAVAGQTSYQISVRALGASEAAHSFWSDVLTATQSFEGRVEYDGGILSWAPVFGVSRYAVKINEEDESVVENANTLRVALTQEGENVLQVAAIYADGNYSEWHSCRVTAYALFFDAELGEPVPTAYYASGDPISLPRALRTGYSFIGWYETEEGAQGGLPFEEYYFTKESNLTLYAAWRANFYEVFFRVGAYAASELDSQSVEYGVESYRLPVPDSRSYEMAFAGWYSQPNGAGTQYTGYDGASIRGWVDTSPKLLYAYWVEIFRFTKVNDGFSVEKGPGIGFVSSIVIPKDHTDESGISYPVTQINDFSGITNLKSVSFYGTVKNVTVGTIGIAFTGCTSLEEIKVLPVDDADARYRDVDGVLLGKDPTTGDTLIYFYPQQHKLTDNTYTIPDGVTRLTAGIFSDTAGVTVAPTDTTILHIVVPASVTQVETRAFYSIYRVQTITFLDPDDPAQSKPLNVADGAFEALNSLDTINFPARLANFSTAVFYERQSGGELSRLRHVNVAEGSEKFAMVEGLITLKTEENGRELLYYPTPRREAAPSIEQVYTTEIVIPEGITSIASDFLLRNPADYNVADDPYRCTALEQIESVTIARTVTEIEPNAFRELVSSTNKNSSTNRTGLKEIIFKSTADDKPLTIGEGAFYLNMCLGEASSELTLPENLVSLGAYAFGGIPGITTVNINCGKDVAELKFADNAFAEQGTAHTTYIEVVNLGKDVKDVNIASVFGGTVKEVNIDPDNENYMSVDGVVFDKEMKNVLFFSDSKTEFSVPESITEIGANLFKNRVNLTQIEISSSLVSIGDSAFEGCTSLALVEFKGEGSDPLTIGARAFYGCSALKTITLPARTVSLGSHCFDGTSRKGFLTINLNEGLKTIGDGAFAATGITEITIPSTVEELQLSSAKSNALNKLATGTLPSQTGTLDLQPLGLFDNCYFLKKINVEAANTHYGSKDGVLYGKDDNGVLTDLLFCPRDFGGVDHVFNVPAEVTKVHSRAFYMQGNTNHNPKTDYITEIRFPETVNELVLEPEAFSFAYSVGKITLPKGLTEIGEFAFYATYVTSVEIPNTVEIIHSRAFYAMSNLRSLVFAPGGEAPLVLEGGYNTHATSEVTAGDGMFISCPNLTAIDLPERLTEIGDFLFYGSVITKVHVPAKVTKLGLGAFTQSSASSTSSSSTIESVTFAEGCAITEIPESAFRAAKISTIELPAGVQTIGRRAFYGTMALQKITLNASLETIGEKAFESSGVRTVDFSKCTLLTEIGQETFSSSGLTGKIVIPACVTTIGEKAFFGSETLAQVEFAEGSLLSTIGKNAFGGAVGLTSVSGLGTHLTKIGESAFSGCTQLASVSFVEGTGSLASIEKSAFAKTKLTDFHVPNSTSNIELGANLFDGDTEPLTVHLSAQVNKLQDAFLNATIKAITVEAGSEYFSVDETQPILYDHDDSVIFIFGEVTGVFNVKGKEVGASAFEGQTGITKLVISSTVLRIGAKAFKDCVGLTAVELQNGSALEEIGDSAFQNCSALETINLDATRSLKDVTEGEKIVRAGIGASAFDGCVALTAVDISRSEGLTRLGDCVFRGTTKLKTAQLPKTLNYLGKAAFQNSGLTRIDLSAMESLAQLHGSVSGNATETSTGASTFEGCENLAEVLLPEGLLRIGGSVFQGCTSLTAINLPSELVIIGINSFKGTKLQNVVIPGNVGKVGYGAFADIDTLESVEFRSGSGTLTISAGSSPTTATRNNSGAFENSTLSKLTLNEKISTIDTATFYQCKNLTTVEIPASVTKIGAGAFAKSGLTSITIPSSVTSVGAGAFAYCEKLTNVTFENGTAFSSSGLSAGATSESASRTSWGIFEYSGVETVELGNRLVKIPASMFYSCEKLVSVTIPSNLTEISQFAFARSGLKSVTFGDMSKATFKASSFRGCALESVEVPNAKSFESYVFMENKQLTTVTFASDFALTAIPAAMFQDCESLNSVTFPDAITDIKQNAFRNTGFTTITIPSTVTKFSTSSTSLKTDTTEGHQFAECKNLQTVVFAAGSKMTDLGKMAFADCVELKSVEFGDVKLTGLGWCTFEGCPMYRPDPSTLPKSLTTFTPGMAELFIEEGAVSFTVPDQFIIIGERAFENSTLQEVKLHSGVTEIGINAFAGTVFDHFEIPATVTTIGYGAFANNTHLREITIPESVTTLGNGSGTSATSSLGIFYGCTALQTVNFPKQAKFTALGNYMFYGCKALKSVTLPDTLTHLGTYTFTKSGLTKIDLSNLTSLTSLSGAANGSVVTSLGYQFQECTELTQVTLPAGLEYIGGYVFDGCTGLQNIVIPGKVKLIGNYCFRNCTNLKSISFPDSVTTIGNYCFDGCSELGEVEFGKGLETLWQYVFRNCSKIETLDFSETKLKWIGTSSATSKPSASTNGYTFQGCTNLSQVLLPETVVSISAYVFKDCKNLKNIEIPSAVTVIGNNCFDGSGIENVALPASLANDGLGTKVFNGCSNLKTVYVHGFEPKKAVTADMFTGCKDFTIYTDLSAEAFKSQFVNWADFNIVGNTTLEQYKEIIKADASPAE